ncbi:hypothetical protein CCR97_20600 [Rhodoplanes elegans]|uniref:Uncharacterized protein n=1 Tax=Rhodoplanes elegans TaxID=29408 RepID=A0A327KIS5_9BRAD|nr:phage protein Gp27 family protein [Rhodoplanes elegans]MBK5960580.1 hypothetical protein [Rhodoplanes elegans]RAI37533.1 hypothetical protein CH338_15760 [Rhodoplanes elegans]
MARGRGQLSKLDRLPDWADEAKMWAFRELKANKRTALDILEEFNARLRAAALMEGVMDPPQVSRSAFGRASMRLSVLGARLAEAKEIAAALAPKFEEAGDDSLTLLISESIKMLAHEMLSNAGELEADGSTAQMLMFTGRALEHAEKAKRISSETRRKIETEFQAKAAKAVDAVAASKGLSAETVESIKAKILGVTRPVYKSIAGGT